VITLLVIHSVQIVYYTTLELPDVGCGLFFFFNEVYKLPYAVFTAAILNISLLFVPLLILSRKRSAPGGRLRVSVLHEM